MMHAGRLEYSPRLQRVHALLRDGREHSTRDIMARTGACAVSAAIAELRWNGAVIDCRQGTDPIFGGRIWLYRMVRPATKATT